MNTYELAHEFYGHSCIQITKYRTKMPLPKKEIPMHHTDPGAILLDVKIKIATGDLILMLLSTIV